MTQTAKVVMTGDDADLIRKIQNQEQQIARLGNRLDQVSRRGTAGANSVGASIGRWATSIARAGLAYFSVQAALGLIRDANREIIQQSEELNKKADEQNRKFRIQSGLRGLEAEAAQKRIAAIAWEVPIGTDPIGTAKEAATQLVSSGFSAEEASGESLRVFLQGLAASNQTGKDVDAAGLAKAAAGYLESQGLDKTSEDLGPVLQKIQTLFLDTNVQIADLQDFAKKASGFKGALSIDEQFASFATLLDSGMPAAEATTALSSIVQRFQTARASTNKVAALKKLGLKPEDVDFVGEDIDTVLERVGGGLEGLPEEERKAVLKPIVEEAGIPSLLLLLQGRKKIQKNVETQQDASRFQSALKEATSGRAAAAGRQTVEEEELATATDEKGDLLLKELRIRARRAGANPVQVAFRSKAYEAARAFGASPETAGLAFGSDEATAQGGYDFGGSEVAAAQASLAVKEGVESREVQVRRRQLAERQRAGQGLPAQNQAAFAPLIADAQEKLRLAIERQTQLMIEQRNSPQPVKVETPSKLPSGGVGRPPAVALSN